MEEVRADDHESVDIFYTNPLFTEDQAAHIAEEFLAGKNPKQVYQIVQELLKLELKEKIGEGKDPQEFLRGGPARAALVHECKTNNVVNEKMAKEFFKNPESFLKKYKMPDFLLNHFSSIIDRLSGIDGFNDTQRAMHWIYFTAVQPLIVAQANALFSQDAKLKRVNDKYQSQTNLPEKAQAEVDKTRTQAVKKYFGSTKKYFTSDPDKITKQYAALLESTFNAMQKIQAEGNLGQIAKGREPEKRPNKFVETLKRTLSRRAASQITKNQEQVINSNNPTPPSIPVKNDPQAKESAIENSIRNISSEFSADPKKNPILHLNLEQMRNELSKTIKQLTTFANDRDSSPEWVMKVCEDLKDICQRAKDHGMEADKIDKYLGKVESINQDAQEKIETRCNYL